MRKILILTSAMAIFMACNAPNSKEDKASLTLRIDSIEKVLYSTAANEPINIKNGELAVNAYARFAEKFPEDSLASDYLFKAGEVASSIKMTQPAIKYFDKLLKQYPNHKKAPIALFLKGFIYENDLHELGKATTVYNEVIKLYPNSRFAADAQACINNLGKSPEELIKEFEEKNKGLNQ
jgi:outer membrane protein assembly factor BamD (BamD/ComL family)